MNELRTIHMGLITLAFAILGIVFKRHLPASPPGAPDRKTDEPAPEATGAKALER